jgi:hypothetical protein
VFLVTIGVSSPENSGAIGEAMLPSRSAKEWAMGFWSTVESVFTGTSSSPSKALSEDGAVVSKAFSPSTLGAAGRTLNKSDDPDAKSSAGGVLAAHRWEQEADKQAAASSTTTAES